MHFSLSTLGMSARLVRYETLWHILATGFLPAFPHLLVTSSNFGLLSRLYTGLQSNMEMLGHAGNPAWFRRGPWGRHGKALGWPSQLVHELKREASLLDLVGGLGNLAGNCSLCLHKMPKEWGESRRMGTQQLMLSIKVSGKTPCKQVRIDWSGKDPIFTWGKSFLGTKCWKDKARANNKDFSFWVHNRCQWLWKEPWGTSSYRMTRSTSAIWVWCVCNKRLF